MWLPAFSPFSRMFSKSVFTTVCKKSALCGKGFKSMDDSLRKGAIICYKQRVFNEFPLLMPVQHGI